MINFTQYSQQCLSLQISIEQEQGHYYFYLLEGVLQKTFIQKGLNKELLNQLQ